VLANVALVPQNNPDILNSVHMGGHVIAPVRMHVPATVNVNAVMIVLYMNVTQIVLVIVLITVVRVITTVFVIVFVSVRQSAVFFKGVNNHEGI
jgi:hypothetical protein